MLAVRDVSKNFGGLTAVDDVSFTIEEEELVGLIGPNGAGKTTLFNCISGVHTPEEDSSVRFYGNNLTGASPHAVAQAGLVRTFQIVRVFEEMSVLDNVAVGATFGDPDANTSLPNARERGKDLLDFVGLIEEADIEAGRLTIAEQKQLELARALATDPDMVMLDEIASGLTPKEISDLTALIARIRDDLGISVLWIEHVMDAILGTVDRVIVLKTGRKIAEGPPREIRNDDRVAEAYLGEEI